MVRVRSVSSTYQPTRVSSSPAGSTSSPEKHCTFPETAFSGNAQHQATAPLAHLGQRHQQHQHDRSKQHPLIPKTGLMHPVSSNQDQRLTVEDNMQLREHRHADEKFLVAR